MVVRVGVVEGVLHGGIEGVRLGGVLAALGRGWGRGGRGSGEVECGYGGGIAWSWRCDRRG